MMSSSMRKTAGAITLFLAAVGTAAAAPLFQPVTVLSRAAAASQPAAQAVLSAPSSAAVQEVRVEAGAVVAAQRQLEFELLGTPVQALQQRVENLHDGGSIW
jgi:PhoPQ-activated pathogenicity-related protein